MSSLIDELARQGILTCPSCHSGAAWDIQPSSINCRDCGAVWPVRNRVVDFFNQYKDAHSLTSEPPEHRHEVLVKTIIDALELNQDEETYACVTEIVLRASTWTCESAALSAEINDLLDRFAAGPQETALPPSAPDANREPRIRFDRHYLPTTLWSGASISANVRVTNIGAYAWSSHAADGLTLSTWWLRNGSPTVSGYTTATRFPIDVLPGRSISIPLRIETPSKSGAYVLRVGLARQDGGGAVSDFLDVPLHIAKPRYGLLNRFLSRSTRTLAREGSVEVHPGISDYGKDHAAGVGIVETTLKQRAKPGARILEIGSGTHPHLAWLTDYQVAAVDISSPLLELGSLYFRGRFISRLAFLCADALNPPFRAGSFDVVAMFSALHHFAEPEILLERLAALLKPSGFIAVMCEPVGDTLEKPDTIRDLLKGINEQVFSVDEYLGIFQRAGLHGDHIRTDGGSLKAILSRQRPA